ncbi:LrgB family protein [Alicycliphilus sp. B1]|nr:LrgB family protein [Alicycliphilus sp. B1]
MMDALRTLAPWLAASPLPWLVLTLVAYALALALYRRSGAHPLLIPVLTAVAVAIMGIAEAVMAGPLLRLLRVRGPAVRGFAIGLTAHAIGTARELQVHPTAGAFTALAMGLDGVATVVLAPVCVALLGWL